MNYGLQIASSGVLTAMHRTDVLAANLANMDTAGFKPDWAGTLARDPVRIEDGVLGLPSDRLLERLGAGALAAPVRTSFAQGPITQTGRDLDLALRGEGFFSLGGESGPDSVRLTRDGRFTLDARGRLVATASGLPVLDTGGRPITLGPGQFTVGPDGAIFQDGNEVARLAVVAVADAAALRKAGANLFTAPGQDPQPVPGGAQVLQGHLEGSAVDEIKTMMDLTSAAQAISANLGMVQYHDRLLERAINTLGRIA